MHEDAECPAVDSSVMTLVEDHLRRHVLGGSAECPGLGTVRTQPLGEPKVHLSKQTTHHSLTL